VSTSYFRNNTRSLGVGLPQQECYRAIFDSVLRALPHGEGYTLSLAKQVLSGRLDSSHNTMEHDIRLV
jgi:hypothetical protein